MSRTFTKIFKRVKPQKAESVEAFDYQVAPSSSKVSLGNTAPDLAKITIHHDSGIPPEAYLRTWLRGTDNVRTFFKNTAVDIQIPLYSCPV